MAYMQADTANKVGFRPYAATNPQGAAVLSGWDSSDEGGLGEVGQGHNPFTPRAWHLHGLGAYFYNRPLDPWELYSDSHPGMHGLGDFGYMGDASGNAGTDNQVAQAADDFLSAGAITTAEHEAILDGSMTFQDVLGYDPTDQASWTNAVGTLQQWNSQLQAIEAQVSSANLQLLNSGTQPPPAFTSLAAQVNQQRQQYESLAQQFINAYRSVTGNVPSGLTGLGILPVVAWSIGIGAALVAVYFGYQAFQNWKASINVQQTVAATAAAQQSSSTATNAALMIALQKAQASGDTTTANSILATLQKTAAPTTGAPMSAIEAWMTTNAKWIGLGAAALVVLPGLFGGRRR
jgi:hypothetical protein